VSGSNSALTALINPEYIDSKTADKPPINKPSNVGAEPVKEMLLV
jgi:hypothetical protein